ncbi:MAG: PorT family protein [Weeksellaceae bacterium]|nr:PorT family protein [Weeksellaceae bacterium]
MKKLILVGALALFGTVNAQEFKYGLKAGYAASKMTIKPNATEYGNLEEKFKPGFSAGGFVEYMFSEKLALQGELQYANLGGTWRANVSEPGISMTMDVKNSVNQILIPVSLKYYVLPQLSIYAGPFAGFKTSVKSDLEISGLPADVMSMIEPEIAALEAEFERELDEGTQSTQIGVFVGTDYSIYRGLFVDARYSLGLTNWVKDPMNGEESKMSFFQIGLGYKF